MPKLLSPARLWLSVFGLAYLALWALFAVAVFTPAPYGDLTRIGRIPEADFGWRARNASIEPSLLDIAALREADVLVIGDSFSVGRTWQTALTAAGLKVATTHWDQLGGALCSDFGPWLRKQGFQGRTVIVQSIQRLVVLRVEISKKCAAMPHAYAGGGSTSPIGDEPPGWAFNDRAKLSTGIVTWLHGWRARQALEEVVFRDSGTNIPLVRIRPLTDGCRQFSHALCDRGLFLADDVVMGVPGPRELAFAQRFKAALAETPGHLQVVWMVIPDKTTVYAEPRRGADFGAALQGAGLGPDLFADAQQSRSRMMDFYWPNDSHLSNRGMLHVGGRMREWLLGAPMPP